MLADFTKDVQYIRKMVENSMYDISQHATERMNERKMNLDEVENILLNENVKLAKEQGKGPRYEFFTNTNDKIIIMKTIISYYIYTVLLYYL